MTFGEKLKQARQKAALSQEQLSEKLHVSRSAVAKWETDKGMPDIDNLKAVSQLLGVSIDYLLDDGEMLSFATVKQPIDLESFEKTGKCRSKYDAAALSVFPDAQQIYPLIRKKKLSAVEKVLEWTAMPTSTSAKAMAFAFFTITINAVGCSPSFGVPSSGGRAFAHFTRGCIARTVSCFVTA